MTLPPPSFSRGRHAQTAGRAFALVIVLIIVSVLALVAVGYLSSMSQERATANAFGNKARAEESAQAGVDTAMGILKDYFKAFPDSATVWDVAQSQYAADPSNPADSSHPNAGTSLYFRAVPTNAAATSTDSPNPAPGNTADATYNDANYVHGNSPGNTDGTSGADGRKIFVLPLVSGATVERLENKANSIRGSDDTTVPGGSVKALKAANSVNLNARRSTADTTGWLGTPPEYVNPANTSGIVLPKPFVVPWVEIKQQDGSTIPPVIGRYAFWVEDESFRANVSYADGRTDGGGTFQPNDTRRDNDPTAVIAKTSLNATDMSLLGLFTFLGNGDPTTARTNLLGARTVYPGKIFPDSSAYAHATGLNTSTNNGLRYLTTTQSAGLNLSRHGTQRLSLNAVVDQSVLPTNTSAIQTQFDKIVKAIQFHAPNFGQRFYRTSANVTPAELNGTYVSSEPYVSPSSKSYTQMYDARVAANIRDYIDKDAFPTCVMPADASNPNGKVAGAGAVTAPIGDTGPAWALGKDSAPFMQECGARYRGTITGSGATATYQLKTDYYIEVWNMSNRDVNAGDLGPNAYIRIGNPTQWFGCRNDSAANKAVHKDLTTSDGSVSPTKSRPPLTVPPQPTPRDFDIDISACVFPAGMCTVVTTDPDYADIITVAEAKNHVFVGSFKSPGTRVYNGPLPVFSATGVTPVVYCNAIITVLEDSTNNTTDYRTDTVIGSDWGHIDSLGGALTISYSGQIYFPYTGSGSPPNIYGGFLRGNWTNSGVTTEGKQASALGDPRTNNEQLKYDPSSSSSSEKTRYTNYTQSGTGVYPTFGQLNYQSCRPNRPDNPWPDFPPLYSGTSAVGNNSSPPSAADLDMSTAALGLAKAPAVIANGPLTSIGQLGDVFDPARLIYSSGTIESSRGGGRSFKIGQHDDRWDGDETSLSRGWTSWRLTDFLCVADPVTQPGLVNPDGISQSGLFNINGITRDDGAALRTAVYGFLFRSAANGGDPTLASSPSSLQIDALVSQITARLNASPLNTDGTINTGTLQTGAGPFWERGEISELPLFGRTVDPSVANSSTTYATTALTGVSSADMSSKIFDRGREELVRRLIEMTTTRGSVFTVYAIGQSLQPDPNNASTRRVVGTHRLKVTFRLAPKGPVDTATGTSPDFHPGTDSAGKSADGTLANATVSYDPNTATQLSKRFAKPDHYDIQVISTSSGSD